MSDTFSIPSPGVPLWFGNAGDPLVMVVHDYFGRLPGLSTFAETLAREGFSVAVPDLYDGVATKVPKRAEQLMDNLDVGIALAELDDVLALASARGSQRVGIVGFSMGGWLGLLCAQGGAADAVVAYYATLGAADHGVVPSPLLLHYAELDTWGPGETPPEFLARLEEHGTPITEHVYLGTQHSFANADIAANYDRRAAELARERTVRFLLGHLPVGDE